jgi:hypothetical protein
MRTKPAMKLTSHILRVTLSLAALALSGCVSAKYQPADKNISAPFLLNLTAAQPPVAATVISVIPYHGLGSWKRDAFWDEYVVSVANRGSTPLVFEAAGLTDFRGDATAPGTDPWLLEKESMTRQEELSRTNKATLVQVGAVTAGGVSAFGAALGGAAGAASAFVFLPVYVAGAVARNVGSRHDIEAEFARRRLALPATIAPGQAAQGSLFFRISPGPQRLALTGRAGADPIAVVIDLAPLKGLHLQPSPAPAK